MTSFVLLLVSQTLFHLLCFLHDEPHLYLVYIQLNTGFCARNITRVARARRTMRLSRASGAGADTTIHVVCLLWLSWAAQQIRSWAWGPYNDDWRRHIAPKDFDAGGSGSGGGGSHHMYRVVLPRANETVSSSSSSFYNTGNTSAATITNESSTATGTNGMGVVPLSTWTPPSKYNSTTTTTTITQIDTTCGVTSPLYTLQISGADGYAFNEWWLKLSGNSLLFTSQAEKATSFGVNSDTKHLCIPRSSSSSSSSRTGTKFPLIAIVETRLDQGPLYLLDANRTAHYEPDYEPIVCDGLGNGSSSLLSCSWNGASTWSGCGLQLELGVGVDPTEGNLNCSGISLNARYSA